MGDIIQFNLPDDVSVAMDVEAFDEAIRAHGVQFEHFRGMPDPTGLVDRHDVRRPGAEASGGSNNMVYTCAGTVTALFTGQSKSLQASEGGVLDSATAQITVPRTYDDSDESVYLRPMDRLFLAENTVRVPRHQVVEHHATGRDRLNFEPVCVQDLMDSNKRRWTMGKDFELEGQDIVWGTKRPEVGQVYAVRYLYRPFWYVDRLSHETRVVQQEDVINGTRSIVRAPQAAVVKREYVFQNEFQQDTARKVPGPAEGSLGPR